MLYSVMAQGGRLKSTTGKGMCQVSEGHNLDHTQPLIDQPKGKRPQPWQQHHAAADLLAYAYDGLNQSKADRLRTCAPRLLFERRKAEDGRLLLPNEPGALRLHTAWFCRVRLCPICQWRRSLKVYGQAIQVVRAAQAARPSVGWVALTLTMRNCTGPDLPATMTQMLKAWHNLTRQKAYKAAVLGSLRSLEITHNTTTESASFDTYHPHIHAMLCVPAAYWHKGYISRAGWASMWQKALHIDYIPQVWVQRVKGETAPAIAEVCKYASKPGAYIIPDDLELMQSSVQNLDAALHRRRLIAWNGWLKSLHRQLGLDDAETGDLVNTDAEQPQEETTPEIVAFGYAPAMHNYYRERTRNDDKTAAESHRSNPETHTRDS